MDAYKKSYYNKKFSNDLNFALQGKRASWIDDSVKILSSPTFFFI